MTVLFEACTDFAVQIEKIRSQNYAMPACIPNNLWPILAAGVNGIGAGV
jgi:hypothetical protein